tara:strand:- start:42 stop:356 length:315 start_codon:yes stop_codon:yes gene_type:complete
MTEKIDTQGMSGPATKGCTDNVYPHDENGEPILPRAVITPRRIYTPEIVKELKILINEVLDAREGKTGISYFDTEHFKHSVDEEEPPYKPWQSYSPYRLDELQE